MNTGPPMPIKYTVDLVVDPKTDQSTATRMKDEKNPIPIRRESKTRKDGSSPPGKPFLFSSHPLHPYI
jgi:hypothetical protein